MFELSSQEVMNHCYLIETEFECGIISKTEAEAELRELAMDFIERVLKEFGQI